MGTMQHHAIIVTSFDRDLIDKAHREALRLFNDCAPVSSLEDPEINGYRSFLICPDGSKEGWKDSELGDEARTKFKNWIDDQVHEDGSNSLTAIEITFGEIESEIEWTTLEND